MRTPVRSTTQSGELRRRRSTRNHLAGPRDSLCAALAAQLIDNESKFSEDVARWATAAMSCAASDFPRRNSLPTRRRINDLLEAGKFRFHEASER